MKNSVLCFLHTNTTYACGDLKENKGKKTIFKDHHKQIIQSKQHIFKLNY